MTDSISVVVVDDHRVFAESLSERLGAEEGIEPAGIAGTAQDALLLVMHAKPNVVLLDQGLPDDDGVSVARAIKDELGSSTAVVMLTSLVDEGILLAAIEAGCSGYITKTASVSEVVDAVRSAAAGESVISPSMLARLLPRVRAAGSARAVDLTEREREILHLMAEGLTNTQIAQALSISPNTARTHVQNVMQKLGAHSRLKAVTIGMRDGILRAP